MKQIFTLFASFLFVFSSFANHAPSRLSVFGSPNSSLMVVIDGRQYDRFGSSITFDELSSGYHNIKVYQVEERHGFWKKDRMNLVYSSSLFVKPMSQVNLLVSRSGKVSMNEQQMSRYGNDRSGYGKDDRRYDNDRRYDDRNNNSHHDSRDYIQRKS